MPCYPLAYMYRAPNERRRGCSANMRRPRVSTSPSSVYLVISSGPTPRIARMMHVPVAVCCTVVSLVRSTDNERTAASAAPASASPIRRAS